MSWSLLFIKYFCLFLGMRRITPLHTSPHPCVKLSIAIGFALTREIWGQITCYFQEETLGPMRGSCSLALLQWLCACAGGSLQLPRKVTDCRKRFPSWSTLLTDCDWDKNIVVVREVFRVACYCSKILSSPFAYVSNHLEQCSLVEI